MVALLVFALLEVLARRASLPQSGEMLLDAFAPLAVVILVFADGSTLRRLAGLAPPLATILQELQLPPPQRYVAAHL